MFISHFIILDIRITPRITPTANGINININGGTISKNVYGGGQNGAVDSNINITVNGGEAYRGYYTGRNISRDYSSPCRDTHPAYRMPIP